MGRISKLIEGCNTEESQPIEPMATGKMQPTYEGAGIDMRFSVDTGLGVVTERQFETMKQAIQSTFGDDVKVRVQRSGSASVECIVDAEFFREKLKSMADQVIGVLNNVSEDVLGEDNG